MKVSDLILRYQSRLQVLQRRASKLAPLFQSYNRQAIAKQWFPPALKFPWLRYRPQERKSESRLLFLLRV